ncbi:uncharacterized protein LOC112168286 [Rosa chinensis]|uniref:uncharacterized protein LOC112168286 n=1 Tax=Rosa chinensis TaxID=74649 RepID=UPI001AD9102E|nr:uncharacterized protein LOC112168286 [Rosa chinensis]
MEEPTPPPPTQIPNPPPNSVETPPHLHPKTKKRPLDSDAQIPNSGYFKIRAVLRDIRPNVLEVLRTPDFQNCKAATTKFKNSSSLKSDCRLSIAHLFRNQVKLLMERYKQMTEQALSSPRCDNVPEGQLSSGAPSEHNLPSGISGQKQQAEDEPNKGTYVVGGSAFGWNFITFSTTEPVYYGMTEESFRAQAAKLTTA